MKTKILMLVVLMSCSAALMAQPADNGSKKSFHGQSREMGKSADQKDPKSGLNLTDAQNDAFKQSMIDTHKQLQPLRNELGEVQAHQKTLMTADKPNQNDINKNIEKMGALRVEMEKIQAQHRLDMRSQLTDEQRLKFDIHKGKTRQHRGQQAMGQGRGMQKDHSMN